MLPCYAFLFLNAVIAFVYAVTWCRARSWEWRDGVLTFIAGTKQDSDGWTVSRMIGNPGAQGWSWVVGYASETDRECADLRVHENTHVVQEFVCSLAGLCIVPVVYIILGGTALTGVLIAGPVGAAGFALLYGALFFYFYLTEQADEEPGWYDDYRRNPFERQAFQVQDEFIAGKRPGAWGA
jgi:hypothetical protein